MVKFNKKIAEELCNAREHGISINDCANLCDIDRRTVYRWLDKGREAQSGLHKEFYERFQKSTSKFKYYHLDKITKDKSWQSSAWILERTFPEEYGRREKIEAEVESKIEATLEEKNRVDMDEDELEELLHINDDFDEFTDQL